MDKPDCQVKGCVEKAFLLYGEKWICGKCMMKIINRQNEIKNREVELLNDL